MRFVIAIGQHQQNRIRCDLPGKVEHKFQARIVAPMQIFDDDDQRRLHRQVGEELHERIETATFFLLWFASRQIGINFLFY